MEYLVLPPKVSGFYDAEPPALLQVSDLQQSVEKLTLLDTFRDLVFADCTQEPSRSYHWAMLWLGAECFFIFLNKYYTLAACSRVKNTAEASLWRGRGELPANEYTTHEGIWRILSPHFTMLPPVLLRTAIDPDQGASIPIVAKLEFAEFAEFSYWEPKNIGQVIFNNWSK